MAKIPFALGNVGSANSLASYVSSLDSAQQNSWQNSSSSTVYRFSTEERLMQAAITCYGSFPVIYIKNEKLEIGFILDGIKDNDKNTPKCVFSNGYAVSTPKRIGYLDDVVKGLDSAKKTNRLNTNIYNDTYKFKLGCAVNNSVLKVYFNKFFPQLTYEKFINNENGDSVVKRNYLCAKIYPGVGKDAVIVRVCDGGAYQPPGAVAVIDIQMPIFYDAKYSILGTPITGNKKFGTDFTLYGSSTVNYDYKSASINAYSPEFFKTAQKAGVIKNISDSVAVCNGINGAFSKKSASANIENANRPYVRFFIPSDERNAVENFYGEKLPDDLFEEGPAAITTIEIEEPKIPESDGSIFATAIVLASDKSKNYSDCGLYVWDVLYNSGVFRDKQKQWSTHAWVNTFSHGLNEYNLSVTNPGWKARVVAIAHDDIDVNNALKIILPGDVVLFNRGHYTRSVNESHRHSGGRK